MPSVRILHGGLIREIPAQRIKHFIATRYHGGDICVVLGLDDNPDLTFMVDKHAPRLVMELAGIERAEHTCGSIAGIPDSVPRTYIVEKGSVGNAVRF